MCANRLAKIAFSLLASSTLFSASALRNPSMAADDVYRTVDAQGNVTYSDHPLSPDSVRVPMHATTSNPSAAVQTVKQDKRPATTDAQRARAQAQEQQQQADQEAERKKRCDAARNRYAQFSGGGRVFRTDEQGNRVYYSDQEIDQQRQSAKADMDASCGP